MGCTVGPIKIMEEKQEGKYKLRFVFASQPAKGGGTSLKEQYEEEKKEELIVQNSTVVKLSQAYSAVVKAVMAALVLVGVVSLVRPELRQILAEILLEAIREIKGF